MEDLLIVPPNVMHFIFLHFFLPTLEELFHEYKNEFSKKRPIQIFIILLYFSLILIRSLSIYESHKRTTPFITQYEIIWLLIQICGAILDLVSFYLKCLNKISGIFTIIISSYILIHSTIQYYFINDTSGQYFFSAYIVPLILVYIVSGLFICYNYYIFSIALLIGLTIVIIFSFVFLENLKLVNKISIPIICFCLWGSLIIISYFFEQMLRILFYKNKKSGEKVEDLYNLFNVYPNEVLLISENKNVHANSTFFKSFFSDNDKNKNKDSKFNLTYKKVLKLASKMEFEEDSVTMKSIIMQDVNNNIEPEKFQNKIFVIKSKNKEDQHFTYRFGKLEFENTPYLLFIFINLSLTFELEKEKYDKKNKRILLSQITNDMRTPITSMLASEELLEMSGLNNDQKDIEFIENINSNDFEFS